MSCPVLGGKLEQDAKTGMRCSGAVPRCRLLTVDEGEEPAARADQPMLAILKMVFGERPRLSNLDSRLAGEAQARQIRGYSCLRSGSEGVNE